MDGSDDILDSLASVKYPVPISPCIYAIERGGNNSLPAEPCTLQQACAGNPRCQPIDRNSPPITFQVTRCNANRHPGCSSVALPGERWEAWSRSRNEAENNNCGLFFKADYCTMTAPSPSNMLACCLGIPPPELQPRSCGGQWGPNVQSCRESNEVEQYCRRCDNLLRPECQQFCPIGDATNRASWCDAAFQEFCTTSVFSVGEPACACYVSPLLQQGPPAPPPVCFDPLCSSINAYKTPNDLAIDCSGITLCNQVINCINVGECNIGQAILTQRCGDQSEPQPEIGGLTRTTIIILIVVGVIAVGVIILFYFLFLSRRL